MQPEIDSSEQEKVKLLIKKAELKTKNAELEVKNVEYVRLKAKIAELEAENIEYVRLKAKIAKLKAENAKLEAKYVEYVRLKAKNAELEVENAELLKSLIEEYTKKLESKKNRKFQTKCIQIAKEILNEKSMIEYRPPFLNGLELDAFFQKYRTVLEVQEAQHRLHSISWYKDIKKLENIVNRDRLKRCICQDNENFLLEVWYDEKPEIIIPNRIQKIKEFVCLASKSFDLL